MKKLFHSLLIILVLSIMAGCAPLPNPIENKSSTCKLTNIIFDNREIRFTYDKDDRIISYEQRTGITSSSPSISTYNITYDDFGNLMRITHSQGIYEYSFRYDGILISSAADVSRFPLSNSIMQGLRFSYTDALRINRVGNLYGAPEYFDRIVFDSNGNITSVNFTRNFGATSTVFRSTYDNNQNPYKLLPFPIYWVLFRTSIITDYNFLNYFSNNNLLSINTIQYYRYEYNDAGYPVTGSDRLRGKMQFFYENCQ